MQIPNLPNIDPKLFKAAAAISGISLVAAGFLWFQGKPNEIPSTQPVVVNDSVAPSTEIFVHVVGEVKTPGVYTLPANARVIDAINIAGGATDEANLTSINLARILFDGEQVFIANKSEASANSPSSSSQSEAAQTGRVSINLGSLAQLDTLPGIGPAIASRIIEYREQNGPFRQLTDLKEVSGIGDAVFNKIKDLISL